MRFKKVLIVFIFCSNFLYSNSYKVIDTFNFQQDNSAVIYTKIENFIIAQKLDSVAFYISKLNEIETSNYLKVLERISKNEQSYADYYELATKINNRNTTNNTDFIKFIDNLPEPTDTRKIDLDYVYTNWLLISKLRNFSRIEEASIANNKLQTYVLKFNQEDTAVKKANLLLNNHQIVLFLIENNFEEGKKLTLDGLSLAEGFQDKTLQIIYLNHLCDFLVEERDLDGYIEKAEESLALESNSTKKSPYYIQTLEKLIDAYLFKGASETRVNELLSIIYNNPNSRIFSYSLYANFLRNLDEKSSITNTIFNQFEVSNYIEFCKKIETLGEDTLDSNQYNFVLGQSSKLLQSKGLLNEAISYNLKSMELVKNIYSEELSSSLANYRTAQAVKEKEKEIQQEKLKTKYNGIIAALGFMLLLASLFIILRKINEGKILKAKNIEIKNQRDAIEIKEKEKGLLLKEVHHRVKNNFQIVSSLLELQTKGIEDEKALELANDGKNRIKSMAIIHQKLYQNDNNLIDFNEYIRLLVSELTVMYASDKEINTSITSENIMFDVDTAIPLGLIINELITNAYKYAFESDNLNALNISINKEDDDSFKLIVEDNGPGLKNSIDLKRIKSLGLRLVTRLVKQLQGTLIQSNDNGAYFEIHFKDTNIRKLVD